ncbi:hypothetical protein UFOVP515_10 [uncultured Caudovirales phage]|uniref:Uncharacterized protein n=1 Tax=uncultured Caudovirales phage TaxID=2100421 RepID=A0A6J5MKJ3_9CAUD|nr:hypothetical protein UFOVP515_10 [uncultured Caudovirales phage]
MALVPIKIPAGVYRNGTEYQSAGRWYDSNLVRWFENTLRPWGGWRKRSTSQMTGVSRGMLTWRTNSDERYIAAGTPTKLYAMSEGGVLKDITPTTFTSGITDATLKTGYGYGTYGSSAYGVARPDLGAIIPATTWSMDSWGEYLVACSSADGQLLEWQLGFTTPTKAVAITNAPTSCEAVMTTAERFVFALGASGNPRKVSWCDQENNTVWTPSATNQAGDFEINSVGSIKCGKRVRGINLIFTDVDVHVATYIGLPYVYSFEKAGSGCGVISSQAVAAIDTAAIWMSKSGFWVYDGYVKPLVSDVGDYIFQNINYNQSSKVYAVHNSKYGEIIWFYPSSASNENDSYVVYNYREGHWAIGSLARTAGTDRGVFTNPLMISSDGYIYEHEVGFTYDGSTPYAESGPYEIGNGDNIMSVRRVIPDEQTLGEVVVSFKTRMYPMATETTYGPYSAAQPTDVRFAARQVKVRYTGDVLDDWRVGVNRFDVVAMGKR